MDFNLYLITDRKQTLGRDLLSVIEEALTGGVRAVQLREKDLASRALYELAMEIRKITSRHGARLFINDRVDIAMAVNADGVHLGEESMPTCQARAILGNTKLIGVSCHGSTGILHAQDQGADFVTLGPVYHTPSKARYGEPMGIAQFEAVAKAARIPVFALGGIKRGNVPEVIAGGASGISLISAVLAADNPQEEARMLLSLLPTLEGGGK